jgi:hypothetical protein
MKSRSCLDLVIPTFERRLVDGLLIIVLVSDQIQAALCALRVVRKVPDLHDHFIEKAKNLLNDRNHGVLLSGITLVIEMCQQTEECLEEFRPVCIPWSIKLLV